MFLISVGVESTLHRRLLSVRVEGLPLNEVSNLIGTRTHPASWGDVLILSVVTSLIFPASLAFEILLFKVVLDWRVVCVC